LKLEETNEKQDTERLNSEDGGWWETNRDGLEKKPAMVLRHGIKSYFWLKILSDK
jgi:hypothetical protein